MKWCLPALLLIVLPPAAARCEEAVDWPWWRGPNSNNVAVAGQTPPTEWSATENIVWKTSVPGRGHSSPIVVADRVLLTTADESREVQSVLCYDRKNGRLRWKTDVNQGGFAENIHRKNTHASPTLACDGARLFALFNNHGGVQLSALDLDGKLLWQKQAALFAPQRYKFGYAASPLVHEDRVIVVSDYDGDGASIAAFDGETGRELWRTPRPQMTSYSSPIVARVSGRAQLLLSGCDRVVSYDPASGTPLWEVEGPSKATCGTMVWDGDLVFASGGYPEKQTMAIKADGSGEIVWRSPEKCYEQSLLAHNGRLYALDDNGIAICWDAQTGRRQWKERLGGPVSASPVLAGRHVYASNEEGVTFVFRPDPEKFTLVARNQLGDESFATPTIVDSQIFLRVAHEEGERRREVLYCIGATDTGAGGAE